MAFAAFLTFTALFVTSRRAFLAYLPAFIHACRANSGFIHYLGLLAGALDVYLTLPNRVTWCPLMDGPRAVLTQQGYVIFRGRSASAARCQRQHIYFTCCAPRAALHYNDCRH